MPDVPVISDFYPGLLADGFQGILAPRGVSPEIVGKLALASNRVILSNEFRAKARELGLQPAGGTSAEFGRFIAEDARVWSKVVKDNGIRAD